MAKYDNRIRIYLTLQCNLRCPYCVNRAFEPLPDFGTVAPERWIKAINRIRRNVIFTGGEPFLYPGLIDLVNGVDKRIEVKIYSNLTQDVTDFIKRVRRAVLFFGSYHPSSGPPELVLTNIEKLASVSQFNGVVHSIAWSGHLLARAQSVLASSRWRFTIEGDQKVTYAEMSDRTQRRSARCSNKNILVAPNGVRHPCVSTLLRNVFPQENILSKNPTSTTVTVRCPDWGRCAACDGLTERTIDFDAAVTK